MLSSLSQGSSDSRQLQHVLSQGLLPSVCFLGQEGSNLGAHSSLGQPSLRPALLLSTIQLCSRVWPAKPGCTSGPLGAPLDPLSLPIRAASIRENETPGSINTQQSNYRSCVWIITPIAFHLWRAGVNAC